MLFFAFFTHSKTKGFSINIRRRSMNLEKIVKKTFMINECSFLSSICDRDENERLQRSSVYHSKVFSNVVSCSIVLHHHFLHDWGSAMSHLGSVPWTFTVTRSVQSVVLHWNLVRTRLLWFHSVSPTVRLYSSELDTVHWSFRSVFRWFHHYVSLCRTIASKELHSSYDWNSKRSSLSIFHSWNGFWPWVQQHCW